MNICRLYMNNKAAKEKGIKMKRSDNKIQKNIIAFGFILLFTSLIGPMHTYAEEGGNKDGVHPVNTRYNNDVAEMVLSKQLAKPEPQELVDARQKLFNEKVAKATAIAKEKEKELTIKRHEDYVNSIPIIDESSVEGRFLSGISKDAIEVTLKSGTYPSVLMAQAGLESDWGRSGLSARYNNLFGVKGDYKGSSANLGTQEDTGSGMITINAGFRVYPAIKESLEDYGDLMRNGLSNNSKFYSGTWRTVASTFKEATSYLQGRYATDTRYASKLNTIIENFQLNRFDEVKAEDVTPIVVPIEIEPEPPIQEGHYLVERTDSIDSIAAKFDLTPEQLIEINELDAISIYVNQELSVEKTPEMKLQDTIKEKQLVTSIQNTRIVKPVK